MKFFLSDRKSLKLIIIFSLILTIVVPASAGTTQLHIVKYANDGTTILAEKTITYQEMESSLPVQGDGSTHYYLQGPVFVDDPDPVTQEYLRWNPDENTNVLEKDMGAVRGTDVKDLCNLVGGMSPGEIMKVKAIDGLTKEFAYKNIYTPSSRQGPLVITWFKDGQYPDSGFDDGMRLFFFPDTSVNPWGAHVFGNFDWHESADPEYWYYYQSGTEKYPTTTGLSVKYVTDILIYSSLPASSRSRGWGRVTNIPSGTESPDDTSQYGYKGSKLTTYATGILNGTIHLLNDPNSTAVEIRNRIREYSIPFTQRSGTNLTIARLYVYVSKSHRIQTGQGVVPSLQTSFNQIQLDSPRAYIDTDGDEHRNVSATYAYDVLRLLNETGTYRVSFKNPDFDQSVFTVDDVMLLVADEDGKEVSTQYWIGEGCDVILSEPRKGVFPNDATTVMAFGGNANISGIDDASLILVSTGIDSVNNTEHSVKFNKETWYNAFDDQSMAKKLQIPVESFMNVSGNSVAIESTIRKVNSDYLVNRNAILIIEQNRSSEVIYADPISTPPLLPDFSSPVPAHVADMILNRTPSCRLTLHSNPEGALIFVDGSYLGKTTPYILEENPGVQHIIRFELDGFVPTERNLTVNNDTILCENLYSEVYSTKWRTKEMVKERGMTHHGGLYINSRPGPAVISIDGIQMSQRTPAVIYGLKEGSYTVRLSLDPPDPFLKGKSDITFEDQEVFVYPYSIVPVDVAANNSRSEEITVDSIGLRGEPFTINGQVIRKTIPARVSTIISDSFISIYHDLSYVSYPVPRTLNEDHYLMIEPREHHNLSVSVDCTPAGAEVFIDGFRTGFSTPFTFLNISDGQHRIMVSKPGYVPEESLVTLLYTAVPIPTTDVQFTLEEYPSGFLRVVSDPPGAQITIDGKDTGELTPFLFSSVPIGSHSVTAANGTITRKYPDVIVNSLEAANVSAYLNEIQKK